MLTSPFEMKFDPLTVKHLGLKMYSQLPAALAEIVSNAYDAYATQVGVILYEKSGTPESIVVMDDGIGLSSDEINSQFLVIGRNRRDDVSVKTKQPFDRKPTGKKGLGKLALFGMAKRITITTVKDNLLNEFVLDYDALIDSKGAYKPQALQVNVDTEKSNGTTVTLTDLKRVSPFDTESLIDSLSRIFIIGEKFQIAVISPQNEKTIITNERKYETIAQEFIWDVAEIDLISKFEGQFSSITGTLITAEKPISPSSGLRGITLYSRGKLVNLPEYFSESASSHFFSYLTGWIKVDFIDDLHEDVISTNRQALVWDVPVMMEFRSLLTAIVSKISKEWREKRKQKKVTETEEITGINTENWVGSVPDEMKPNLESLLVALGGEDVAENFGPAIKALHAMIPEFPLLHWRHLHPKIRDRVGTYYKHEQYGQAADQGAKIYCEVIRDMTGSEDDGRALVDPVFKYDKLKGVFPKIQLNDLKNRSEENIQEGQAHLSRGLITGFRNPATHAAMDKFVPEVFDELDCLNILSLISFLLFRLDGATVN